LNLKKITKPSFKSPSNIGGLSNLNNLNSSGEIKKEDASSDSCFNYEKEEPDVNVEIYNEQKYEKNKKKDKIKIKQNFNKKKSQFLLSIIKSEPQINQIFINLIKENLSKTSKNKFVIDFPFNLETDTCKGIVAELEKEIDLSEEEKTELVQDLEYLSKNFIILY